MIHVNEAMELIYNHTNETTKESVKLTKSLGRVLMEDILADRPHPAYDRVAMDGIAIKSQTNQSRFRIEGCQKAGQKKLTLNNKDNCMEVMTGATLPNGCDAVIPYEQLCIADEQAVLLEGAVVNKGQNIHRLGSDYSQGDILVKAGKKLSVPDIAVAATVGLTHLIVSKLPSVCIVSTGDELVEIDQQPEEHQIRRSNSYAIHAMLKQFGFENIDMLHLPDRKEKIYEGLEEIIKSKDIVILSGGVSAGKFDYVPQILQDLKVKEVFHKIKQKPGKPMWFGVTESGSLIFGLPGNPISATFCARKYVLPALLKMTGLEGENFVHLKLMEEIKFKKPFTYFHPVEIKSELDGSFQAWPVLFNGSGDLASLSRSSGFIELPFDKEKFNPGEVYKGYTWNH